MTALAASAPVAVQHDDHAGPLLACLLCRREASGVFRRRYWALRSRRGVTRTRL